MKTKQKLLKDIEDYNKSIIDKRFISPLIKKGYKISNGMGCVDIYDSKGRNVTEHKHIKSKKAKVLTLLIDIQKIDIKNNDYPEKLCDFLPLGDCIL